MNIGIDIRPLMSPVRSGVGEYTHELLNAIFATDTKNQYFLFSNSHHDVSQNIPKWTQDNIHYVHKKWPNKLFNVATKIFNLPRVDKIIKKIIPLTPHSSTHNLDYFFSPNFSFTALTKHTKHILTVHDLSFEFFPEFFSFKQRLWHWAINPKKQCQEAHTIICPSENTKRDIIDLYKIPAEKIKVIYPGVNCPAELTSAAYETSRQTRDDITKKYNLPQKFILFLGTVEPRKNIMGLIDAFEQSYPSLTSPYSLIIAGHKGWNDKQIYNKYTSSPMKNRIKFIGSIDAADKPILYAMSQLFVYPSFYEGFGFPPLEAMACGTPVITSNRSSLPEITGHAAYLVNPNRPTELAGAITEMLNKESLRTHFKDLGLAQTKKFTWEKTAKEFISLLQ